MDSSSAVGAAPFPSQAFVTTSDFPLAAPFLPVVGFPRHHRGDPSTATLGRAAGLSHDR